MTAEAFYYVAIKFVLRRFAHVITICNYFESRIALRTLESANRIPLWIANCVILLKAIVSLDIILTLMFNVFF